MANLSQIIANVATAPPTATEVKKFRKDCVAQAPNGTTQAAFMAAVRDVSTYGDGRTDEQTWAWLARLQKHFKATADGVVAKAVKFLEAGAKEGEEAMSVDGDGDHEGGTTAASSDEDVPNVGSKRTRSGTTVTPGGTTGRAAATKGDAARRTKRRTETGHGGEGAAAGGAAGDDSDEDKSEGESMHGGRYLEGLPTAGARGARVAQALAKGQAHAPSIQALASGDVVVAGPAASNKPAQWLLDLLQKPRGRGFGSGMDMRRAGLGGLAAEELASGAAGRAPRTGGVGAPRPLAVTRLDWRQSQLPSASESDALRRLAERADGYAAVGSTRAAVDHDELIRKALGRAIADAGWRDNGVVLTGLQGTVVSGVLAAWPDLFPSAEDLRPAVADAGPTAWSQLFSTVQAELQDRLANRFAAVYGGGAGNTGGTRGHLEVVLLALIVSGAAHLAAMSVTVSVAGSAASSGFGTAVATLLREVVLRGVAVVPPTVDVDKVIAYGLPELPPLGLTPQYALMGARAMTQELMKEYERTWQSQEGAGGLQHAALGARGAPAASSAGAAQGGGAGRARAQGAKGTAGAGQAPWPLPADRTLPRIVVKTALAPRPGKCPAHDNGEAPIARGAAPVDHALADCPLYSGSQAQQEAAHKADAFWKGRVVPDKADWPGTRETMDQALARRGHERVTWLAKHGLART
jgi:hypothetical protein